MDPSTHSLWTLLIYAKHYPSLQAFPIHSASSHSFTVLLILWASSSNLTIYTTLTCTHRSHCFKRNSYPNTRRCKVLPMQSNLLGDASSSLGLGCPVIAVRTSGHDLKVLHNKLHVLKHACQPMSPWSPTLNDYQELIACRCPRGAKHADLVQWFLSWYYITIFFGILLI
jgi:hypothetical protein